MSRDENKPATISPAISLEFELAASKVCDDAKVDDTERPYQIREWVGYMERKFRSLTADGKITDEDAALVAISLFNPRNTAKQRRGGIKGFWYRLLYYQRYSIYRLLAPVAFGMLHAWYRTSGSLQISMINNGPGTPGMVLFGWNYYVGLFTIVIILSQRASTRLLRIPKPFAEGAALIAVITLYLALATEWVASVEDWFQTWHRVSSTPYDVAGTPRWLNLIWGIVDYLTGYLIEALLFVPVIVLTLSEIFNLPLRHRVRKALKRA